MTGMKRLTVDVVNEIITVDTKLLFEICIFLKAVHGWKVYVIRSIVQVNLGLTIFMMHSRKDVKEQRSTV